MHAQTAASLHDWLMRNPYTLTLGSGFFGFFAHFGVLKALHQAGLIPARLTGASSGALIASCYASGMSIADIEQLLRSMTRDQFWDPGLGFGLLKGERFRAQLRERLPVQHFSECRFPLALSVYNATRKCTQVIDDGDLVPAIYASCALPLLFQPLKQDGVWLMDGGIRDRPALAGVGEQERVLIHHLASKSPWRRASDPALVPPRRAQGSTLVLDGIPRCSPFRLQRGPQVIELACAATQRALTQPWQNVVRVPAHT